MEGFTKEQEKIYNDLKKANEEIQKISNKIEESLKELSNNISKDIVNMIRNIDIVELLYSKLSEEEVVKHKLSYIFARVLGDEYIVMKKPNYDLNSPKMFSYPKNKPQEKE